MCSFGGELTRHRDKLTEVIQSGPILRIIRPLQAFQITAAFNHVINNRAQIRNAQVVPVMGYQLVISDIVAQSVHHLDKAAHCLISARP